MTERNTGPASGQSGEVAVVPLVKGGAHDRRSRESRKGIRALFLPPF